MKSLACTLLADAIEQAARATSPAPIVPTMASGAPVERLRAYAAHDAEALAVLERLAATPTATTDIHGTLLETLTEMREEFRKAPWNRRGPAGKNLMAAIDRAMRLLPPPPPQKTPDEVNATLLRLDEEMRAMIEQHAPHPITAEEIQ